MSGPGEMGNLLKQAQELQRQLDKVKGDLSSQTIEGSAGGGVVRIALSADRREVRGLTIQPDVLKQDDAVLVADLVRAAIQDALRRASEAEKEAIGRVTGGMQLPGFL